MGKVIYSAIWNISEFFNISLGRFAPTVFEGMLGGTVVKKVKDANDNN